MLELHDLAYVLETRRFWIPFGLSLAIATGTYYLTGQEPSSAAIAFFIGLLGFCAGVVLHLAGGMANAE
jgi:hypothetical protein